MLGVSGFGYRALGFSLFGLFLFACEESGARVVNRFVIVLAHLGD